MDASRLSAQGAPLVLVVIVLAFFGIAFLRDKLLWFLASPTPPSEADLKAWERARAGRPVGIALIAAALFLAVSLPFPTLTELSMLLTFVAILLALGYGMRESIALWLGCRKGRR